MASPKRFLAPLVLLLVYLVSLAASGCKDEKSSTEGASDKSKGKSSKAKVKRKGFASVEPQVLFDISTGKQTSLKWEADGKTVEFIAESSKESGTHVRAIMGPDEMPLITCPTNEGDDGRIEMMVRPNSSPAIVEVLHLLCISGGDKPMTIGKGFYMLKKSEGLSIGFHSAYEKNGVFYAPLTERDDALYLETLDLGDNHSCGVRKDGTAVCWGKTVAGEDKAPEGETFTMVDVNVLLSCGIKTDKSIKCWGEGSNLGGPTIEPPPGSFVDIAVGHSQMCAIGTDGKSSCWWTAPPKHLKTDTKVKSLIAFGLNQGSIKPPEGDFTDLQADYAITCGLGKDGTIKCWGSDSDGVISKAPTGTFAQFSLGPHAACALDSKGSLSCWGSLGPEGTAAPAGTFTQVDVGSGSACAIDTDAKMHCWGYNDSKQLEAPAGSYRLVSVGGGFACAIRKDNTVSCWGATQKHSSQPEKITPPLF